MGAALSHWAGWNGYTWGPLVLCPQDLTAPTAGAPRDSALSALRTLSAFAGEESSDL